MSEFVGSPETIPVEEQITNGLRYWLTKEVGSSTVGGNRYLDDFSSFVNELKLPYNDPANTNARKNRSHYVRLIDWTNGFADHYSGFRPEQNELATARQIFCGQMYLSGLFRIQCFMQATDQDDYYRRRLESSHIDIYLGDVVTNRLFQIFEVIPQPDELKTEEIKVDDLANMTLELNRQQAEYVESLHVSGHIHQGEENSPFIESNKQLQEMWTGLITDYIVFAASERDGKLTKVPFLEPKSISEAEIYYPFES